MVISIIFWLAFFLVLLTYLFYPATLLILDRLHPGTGKELPGNYTPFVSVLMAVNNEEKVIARKIKALYESDYPADRFEVIVGSDNSVDMTDPILDSLANEFSTLKIVKFGIRSGKPVIINNLSGIASGEILIITDANVFPERNTIRRLVSNFSDPSVGLTDTRLITTGTSKEGISLSGAAYIGLETRLKNIEGRLWGKMMGPFGGFYAVRKKSYKPNSENALSDDFRICMNVIGGGEKVISDMNSVVYEDAANNLCEEYKRMTRISAGNFQNLRHFSRLLKNPFNTWSLIFISHKVLRWLTPLLWMIMLVMNLLLLKVSFLYTVLLILQLILIILPPLDLILRKAGINVVPIRYFTHLFLMNLAIASGFFRQLGGVESGVWEPTKRN
ncbi:MAG: glycosyltransferase [Bacteroidales bacterium]